MQTLKHLCAAALVATVGQILSPEAEGCTRVTFVGDSGTVITGRTLDWKEPIPTNLYVLPRGAVRSSYDRAPYLTWTSQYASVVAVGYDMGVSEGMNEKGLVCNLLYLPGSVYARPGGDTRPRMSSSVWASYVLDNFATTAQAVEALALDAFQVDAPAMPGGDPTTLHMAISDVTGNSAIIEYVDGKISIYQGRQYQVMTNAPTYDKQLAVAQYWETVGGLNMLPGTSRSQDRFARATFYVKAIPGSADHRTALAGVFGIVDNCAVPTGITVPNQPEVSTTQWRSVSDQNRQVYYFKPTLAPAALWVDLQEYQLGPGSPVMKLDLTDTSRLVVGNALKDMREAPKGFTPAFRF